MIKKPTYQIYTQLCGWAEVELTSDITQEMQLVAADFVSNILHNNNNNMNSWATVKGDSSNLVKYLHKVKE